MITRALFALALALVAACSGETGTIQLGFTTAPGSTLLDSVQRLRVTLTAPRQVLEAERVNGTFEIVLDVEASGFPGAVLVEGFDASDQLVVAGATPPFPVAAINARIVVYLAPPMSIALAPERLPAARFGVGTTALSYGVAIAGGRNLDNTITDDIFIYNSYDHTLLEGAPLPSPRYAPTLATGANDAVYVLGGFDANSVATGTVFRFDTTAPPNGTYMTLAEHPELARGGELAVPLALEHHIITGSPAIDMQFGGLVERPEVGSLYPAGASVTVNRITYAVIGGSPIVRFFADRFLPTTESSDPLSTAVALPGGRVAFVSVGNTRDLLVIDAETGESSRAVDALSVPRLGAAVAATARHVVVAGGNDGVDGEPHPTADILDAETLALVTTIPCLPRRAALATAFLNGQVIIIGGVPDTMATEIELFTPPPP